jgi:hypothetical protein
MANRHRSRKPRRHRADVALEGLEPRSLLSVIVRHPAQVARVELPVSADQSTGPVLGPPTPHEAAKQRFIGKFSGTFVTTRGRFQNQPLQGLILATGGSNQSLRLNLQLQFFLYSDPEFPPTGQVAMSPKSVSSTGTQLLLDLTADPTLTSHGLPTHYTWTVNGGSGGLYTNASGSGTLDVRYNLTRIPHGVHSQGTANVIVKGTVVTTHGLTLDITMPGNRPKNP